MMLSNWIIAVLCTVLTLILFFLWLECAGVNICSQYRKSDGRVQIDEIV